MADVNTDIYKLVQPSGSPFDVINKLGGTLDTVGNLAVGKAVQQGINPDTGQIDPGTVGRLLQQSPIGAMKAPATLDALQRLRSAGYSADQSALDTYQKQLALASHLFGGIASKDAPTKDDVYDMAASALDPGLKAKEFGVTMPLIMNRVSMLNKAYDTGGPKALRAKALEMQTQAASTAEVLHQHSPQGQFVDQGGQKTFVPMGTPANPAFGTAVPNGLGPTTPFATPEGTRLLGPQPALPGGGAVGPDGRPATPGTPAVPPQPVSVNGPPQTLRPGYTEAATGIAVQSAASANELTKANDTSMVRKGMLGNLEEDLQHFTAGPGADWTKLGKAWANRNIPVPESWQKTGGVLDLGSVASQEQFVKQAQMLAQQQFQAIGGTGTDAKFSSAFTTNPNETLSQLGNKGIIRLLKGNEDALQAKNAAWLKYKKEYGPDSYADFAALFNQSFDPRTFQFKYMSKAERNGYVANMDPQDKARLLHDITVARKAGWVSY